MSTLYNASKPTKKSLTSEESAVLKACWKEAFFNRGITCGLVFAVGSFCVQKYGIIKLHPWFGVWPAVAVSGIVGVYTGSLSYSKQVCTHRILALPNSAVRREMIEHLQRLDAAREPTRFVYLWPKRYEFDFQRPMVYGAQMNIYTSKNNFDRFTDVNSDGDQLSNCDTTKPLPTYSPGVTTDDDLRQKDRDEYTRSTASRQCDPPSTGAPPASRDHPPVSSPSAPISEDSRPLDGD